MIPKQLRLPVVLGGLALAVVASFFILPLINYIMAVVALGLCCLKHFKQRLIPALIFSGLLSVVAVIGVGFLFEALFPEKNGFLFLNLINASAALGLGSYIISSQRPVPKIKCPLSDITALVCATTAMFILITPALPLRSSSEFVRFLSSGEDHASHFAMYHRSFKTGSLPYFDQSNTGLIDSLEIYPQGLHHYGAFASSLALNGREPGLLLELRLYYIFSVILIGVLVLLLALLVVDKLHRGWQLWAGVTGASALMLGMGFFLPGWGFLTQTAAYVFLLASLYALQQAIQKRSAFFLAVYAAMLAGVAHSWYLLLPVAGLPALICTPAIWQMIRKNKKVLAAVAIAGLTALTPIALNILLSDKNDPLNEPGGVYILGWVAWLLIGLGFAATILLRVYKKLLDGNNSRVLSLAWYAALACTIGIGTYQLNTAGALAYYFHKSVYTLLLLSIVLIVWCAAKTLMGLTLPLSLRKNILLIAALLAIMGGALAIVKPVYPVVYAHNWFNHLLLPGTLQTASDLYNQNPGKGQDVVYMGSCEIAQDYIANRWTGALFLKESRQRSQFEARIIAQQPPEAQRESLATYLQGVNHNITKIITGDCLTAEESELLQSSR